MKNLVALFALLIFSVSGACVSAADPAKDAQAEPHIKCCFPDGQCLETKRKNCMLKKGKVVQDCASCQGVSGKKK